MDYVDRYLFDGRYLLLGEDGSVVDGKGFPVLQYVFGKIWVNNHAHVIEGKNGFSVEMLYIIFSQLNVTPAVSGAVQLKINQNNLKNLDMVIPDRQTLFDFDNLIQPFFKLIRKNIEETKTLVELREILLSKLMMSDLDISYLDNLSK